MLANDLGQIGIVLFLFFGLVFFFGLMLSIVCFSSALLLLQSSCNAHSTTSGIPGQAVL